MRVANLVGHKLLDDEVGQEAEDANDGTCDAEPGCLRHCSRSVGVSNRAFLESKGLS